MKTCPECHGEGEVKDEQEQAAKRSAALRLLATRIGLVLTGLAVWPASVLLGYAGTRMVLWLANAPLTENKGPSEGLAMMLVFVVVGACAATAIFVRGVVMENWE